MPVLTNFVEMSVVDKWVDVVVEPMVVAREFDSRVQSIEHRYPQEVHGFRRHEGVQKASLTDIRREKRNESKRMKEKGQKRTKSTGFEDITNDFMKKINRTCKSIANLQIMEDFNSIWFEEESEDEPLPVELTFHVKVQGMIVIIAFFLNDFSQSNYIKTHDMSRIGF